LTKHTFESRQKSSLVTCWRPAGTAGCLGFCGLCFDHRSHNTLCFRIKYYTETKWIIHFTWQKTKTYYTTNRGTPEIRPDFEGFSSIWRFLFLPSIESHRIWDL